MNNDEITFRSSWQVAGFFDEFENDNDEYTILLNKALDVIAIDDDSSLDTTLFDAIKRLYRLNILPDVEHVYIKLKEFKSRHKIKNMETHLNNSFERFLREYLEGEFLTRN